jgi:phage-related tail fiber protein
MPLTLYKTFTRERLTYQDVNSSLETIRDYINNYVELQANLVSTNTANKGVRRDASGNFAAGTITASLDGTAKQANNITGGGPGQIPYQTAANTTAMILAGSNGQILQSGGTGAPIWVNPSSITVGNATQASNGNPPGAIMAFARNTPPVGWLTANGQAVSRTTYADLFNAIGITYGAGDGITTFNLPDIRGIFIRGWDNGRGIDPERVFGSIQEDAFQGFKAKLNWNTSGGGNEYPDSISRGHTYDGLYSVDPSRAFAGGVNGFVSDGVHGEPRVASETRPRNIALLFCIKY